MSRRFAAPALALALSLGLGKAHAQDKAPGLTYRLSVGGLNVGAFASLDIPTHAVSLSGANVTVTPRTAKADKRPVRLGGGHVASMIRRILKDKTGQQMSVSVAVVPVNTPPGVRCTFALDEAKLLRVTEDAFTFQPSELPKFTCK